MTWWYVTRYTLKRNVCGSILTCGGALYRALTWGFLVGVRWLPTAVYGCPADWLRTEHRPGSGPRLREPDLARP